MPRPFMLLAALALGPVTAAAAGAAGIAEEGQALARQVCSGCHVVEGVGGKDAVPPLAEVAHDPAMNAERLTGWLSTPHAGMPDLQLTRRQISDIVAYLQSLKGR